MTRAFVFPGQGSQFVGMGKDLADNFELARHTFEEVDSALGKDLSRLMFEGPEEDLNLTENTQPALMAVSVAIARILEKEGGFTLNQHAKYVAGHSLGEYSALTAALAFELADCARLLQIRGRAMQDAVPVGIGAMAAILGPDLETVREIAAEAMAACEKDGEELVCTAANDNAPGQVVVSGHKAAVELATKLASEKGAKRSVILPVSAPFHCTLMAPAAQVMAQALAETNIRPPQLPVVSNVTATEQTDPGEIRRLLVEQITGAVRWRESVEYMRDNGVEELVELGAGKVLTGLARRIDKSLKGRAIGTPDDIKNFLADLS